MGPGMNSGRPLVRLPTAGGLQWVAGSIGAQPQWAPTLFTLGCLLLPGMV